MDGSLKSWKFQMLFIQMLKMHILYYNGIYIINSSSDFD